MDKRLRRSIIGGFNTSDVVAYIDRLGEQHRSEMAELRRELDHVTKERDGAVQNESDSYALSNELEAMRAELQKAIYAKERAERERDAANAELDDVREKLGKYESADRALEAKLTELEQVKARVTDIELEAHERARRIEQDASLLAEKLRVESERTLSEANERAAAIEREANDKAETVRMESERLLGAVRAGFGSACTEAETAMADAFDSLDSIRDQMSALLSGLNGAGELFEEIGFGEEENEEEPVEEEEE